MKRTIVFFAVSLFTATAASQAAAYAYTTHDRVRRPSSAVHISQGLSLEYGKISINPLDATLDQQTDTWQGVHHNTGVSLELMRFLQFGLSHTFVDLKAQNATYATLRGSRVSGDARAVFEAPLFNLELGLGVTASRLSYQRELIAADYYGTGHYRSVGVSHIFNRRLSMYLQGQLLNSRLVPGGGSLSGPMRTELQSGTIGLRLWL